MIITAMRRFGMTDLNEIDRMSYRDFRLRMKAYELRRLDREYEIALLAWQMREIQAKKKSGKNLRYIYTSFDKFFSLEKHEKLIKGEKATNDKPETAAERYKRFIKHKSREEKEE